MKFFNTGIKRLKKKSLGIFACFIPYNISMNLIATKQIMIISFFVFIEEVIVLRFYERFTKGPLRSTRDVHPIWNNFVQCLILITHPEDRECTCQVKYRCIQDRMVPSKLLQEYGWCSGARTFELFYKR